MLANAGFRLANGIAWLPTPRPTLKSITSRNQTVIRMIEQLHSDSKPKIVVAIPCFNTRPFIGDIIRIARNHADRVIVVDDGSYDGTPEIAKTAGALVISHDRNLGYGATIKSCFEEAKANTADILVIIDGGWTAR